MNRPIRRHYKTIAGAAPVVHDVDLQIHDGAIRGHIDGDARSFDARLLRRLEGGSEIAVVLDGVRSRAIVVRVGDQVHIWINGRAHRFQAVTPRPGGDVAGADQGDPFAASPMTGVVRRVLVAPGDTVKAGATLFVVEAMKMEFSVTAPRDVVVDEVRATEGTRVDIQQVVITFRSLAAPTEAGTPA